MSKLRFGSPLYRFARYHFAQIALLFAITLGSLSIAEHAKAITQTEIQECSTYTVRRIEVEGNEFTCDRDIAKRITFAIGKRYSPDDVERTILQLNRWGHLEKMNRKSIDVTQRAYDPATPDFRCFVDILIHVKEKARKRPPK